VPHPAYSYRSGHQTRRTQLLAELQYLGGGICMLCRGIMLPGMELHLHHSDPLAKQMGLPGDVLVHNKCNLSEGGHRNGRAGEGPEAEAVTRLVVTIRDNGQRCDLW